MTSGSFEMPVEQQACIAMPGGGPIFPDDEEDAAASAGPSPGPAPLFGGRSLSTPPKFRGHPSALLTPPGSSGQAFEGGDDGACPITPNGHTGNPRGRAGAAAAAAGARHNRDAQFSADLLSWNRGGWESLPPTPPQNRSRDRTARQTPASPAESMDIVDEQMPAVPALGTAPIPGILMASSGATQQASRAFSTPGSSSRTRAESNVDYATAYRAAVSAYSQLNNR